MTKSGEGMDPLGADPWAIAKAKYALREAERSGTPNDQAMAQSLVNQLVAEWLSRGGN